MKLTTLIETVKNDPKSIEFSDVIAVIDANYDFTPTQFTNGALTNAADQNNGSCKIFAFAKLQGLAAEEALALFGDFYRKDVLLHPTNDDHQNIRNFIEFGWEGIEFTSEALKEK
ncbi:HopJ type III effector protein [Vibrio sp. RC27]